MEQKDSAMKLLVYSNITSNNINRLFFVYSMIIMNSSENICLTVFVICSEHGKLLSSNTMRVFFGWGVLVKPYDSRVLLASSVWCIISETE